jgi:hypothetical protein
MFFCVDRKVSGGFWEGWAFEAALAVGEDGERFAKWKSLGTVSGVAEDSSTYEELTVGTAYGSANARTGLQAESDRFGAGGKNQRFGGKEVGGSERETHHLFGSQRSQFEGAVGGTGRSSERLGEASGKMSQDRAPFLGKALRVQYLPMDEDSRSEKDLDCRFVLHPENGFPFEKGITGRSNDNSKGAWFKSLEPEGSVAVGT